VGECPLCPLLGDGHFGHLRFKFFLKIDFDGHLVGREFALFGGCCWEWKRVKNDVHSHYALKGLVVNIALVKCRL